MKKLSYGLAILANPLTTLLGLGAFFKDLIAKWGVNWGWVLVASRLCSQQPKLQLAPKMHVLDALKAVILLCERNLFSSHTKWTWSLSSLFPPSFQGLVLCVVSFGVQSPKGPKMPFGVPILHAHHVIDNGYTSWYFKYSRQRRNNTFSWRISRCNQPYLFSILDPIIPTF